MHGKKGLTILAAMMILVLGTACAAKMAQEAPAPRVAATVLVEQAVSKGEIAASAVSDSGEGAGADTERLIIRSASLSIVVADTDEAADRISAMVEGLGGYIVDSSRYKYQEGTRASITARIPAGSLDDALSQIRGLATEVRNESISGQDVTEQYVDLESRLRHLEATEQRLETFLENAEDTEAALAVYNKLSDVQADIEQVKGRMKYLEQSAAMSSITIDITPDELSQPIQVGGWHPKGVLRDAFESLVRVVQFLVDALIYILVLILPVLVAIAIPIVVAVWLIRALVRGHKRRKARRVGSAAPETSAADAGDAKTG